MAPSKKIDLRDKVEEGEIDLSMLSLEEVPVREISSVKKVRSLDLSNNHLERLPANFATLTFLTKINLSKNNLKELPENFGNLEKLIHLDLYKNQLQHLPLSFFQLKNLKWLDLKDNPLVPAIAKVAGPCLDNKQCQQCAKNIIQFYIDMNERIKQIKEEQEVQRQKNLAYKAKLERKKKEKKQRQKDKNDNVPKDISTKEVIETVFEPITKEEPVKVKHRKSFFLTFVHVFLFFSLFLYCGLFVVTSLKIKGSENIVECITSLWTNVKGLCPSYLDDYINIFEKNFINFHTFVGNNLIRIHKTILSSPQLLIVRDYFYYMFQSVSKKISDTYHSIF